MTNDQAVALALYELADEIERTAALAKHGSGARSMAENIARDVYLKAKALHYGELDAPEIRGGATRLRAQMELEASR